MFSSSKCSQARWGMPQTCPIYFPRLPWELGQKSLFFFLLQFGWRSAIQLHEEETCNGWYNLRHMNESHARRRWLVMKDLNQNLFLEEVIFNLKEPTIVEGMTTCKGERSQEGGAKPRKRDKNWWGRGKKGIWSANALEIGGRPNEQTENLNTNKVGKGSLNIHVISIT